MPLDANNNGSFLLDVTATDQAQPDSTRKSAAVRVRNIYKIYKTKASFLLSFYRGSFVPFIFIEGIRLSVLR
jgi:hypothetical protein